MALLGDETQRASVQGAVSEQRGTLNLAPLPKEDDPQRKRDNAIVITDTSCKP